MVYNGSDKFHDKNTIYKQFMDENSVKNINSISNNEQI